MHADPFDTVSFLSFAMTPEQQREVLKIGYTGEEPFPPMPGQTVLLFTVWFPAQDLPEEARMGKKTETMVISWTCCH